MNTIKITRQNSKCFQCKRIKVDDFLVISNIRLVVWHLLVIDLRDDGTTEKRVENIPPRYHYSIRYILFLIPYFCSSVEWKTSTDISCCVCVCVACLVHFLMLTTTWPQFGLVFLPSPQGGYESITSTCLIHFQMHVKCFMPNFHSNLNGDGTKTFLVTCPTTENS